MIRHTRVRFNGSTILIRRRWEYSKRCQLFPLEYSARCPPNMFARRSRECSSHCRFPPVSRSYKYGCRILKADVPLLSLPHPPFLPIIFYYRGDGQHVDDPRVACGRLNQSKVYKYTVKPFRINATLRAMKLHGYRKQSLICIVNFL